MANEVSIDQPANGATVVLGADFRVAGTADSITVGEIGHEHEVFPTSVTVSIDGTTKAATSLATHWEGWETTIRLSSAGAATIAATAKYGLAAASQTRSAKITVTAVPTAVDLLQPAGPVGTQEFAVQVAAQHPAGITGTRARVDGQGWVELGPQGGPGTLRLASALVPPGGRQAVLDLQATSGDGALHNRTVQISTVDANDPVIVSVAPGDGAKIPGTAVGATVPVAVSARDAGSGQLTSGLAAVEVQVDGGPWTQAQLNSAGDPSQWSANVFVPGAEEHTLTVRARDAAGRTSATITHKVVVTIKTELHDLSRQTYLADLLAFTSERLRTRAPDGGPLPPSVTAGQLAEVLGQDLAAVVRMPAAQSSAPIPTLRLVIESLARFMRPAAPAPLAAWPVRDGRGAVAADTASGLCDGVIEGATWTTGDPPVLHFDPASAAKVRVPPQESAQLRAREAVTMVARVRPSGPTAGPAAIVSKEGEYAVCRFPDGTLHWALATGFPGWSWMDTGAVIPQGRWSHIAVAYDGAAVRTWLDGVLVHTRQATGPISSAGGSGEVWIGARAGVGEYFVGDIADVAVFDRALTQYELHRWLGRSDDAEGTALWLDDDLPAGAQTSVDNDGWDWITADPPPSHGKRCHRSRLSSGVHQHYFALPQGAFPVDRGDVLVTDVWLDPQNPPREVMLQWLDADGSWEHRAFWGDDLIGWGASGTAGRRRLADLPQAGRWVTLRAPARLVDLEHRMVRGVAFTLYDGRAAWDRTGRVTAPASAAASGYLDAAYAALGRAHGTSQVELRLARGAPDQQRAALAARLGITLGATRPDELDQLLLDPAELDPAALRDLFGLSDPLAGTAATAPTALITTWRLAAQRRRWREADGDPSATGLVPVVDPEVLVDTDLIDAGGPAARLLADRRTWRDKQLAALRAARTRGPTDKDALQTLLEEVLAGVDLDALWADRRAGQDISAALDAAGLTLSGLRRLLQLRDLAAEPLRDAEWEDLAVELLQVLRRRNWPVWRGEERTADVVIDPAVFRDSAADADVTLPPYLDLAARRDWLDRLAARAAAVEAVTNAQTAAIAAADQQSLPIVRDALVATLDPGIGSAEVIDALTEALFIDIGAGPQDLTSRVEQAIEAVQGLVIGARANRLAPQRSWPPPSTSRDWALKKTDAYPPAAFDEEWQWMGAYAAWQAAMSVFFRPELMLYPALRPDATPPYGALLKTLAEAGTDLTPPIARAAGAAYKDSLDAQQRSALGGLLNLVLTDQLTPTQVSQLAAGQPQLLSGRGSIQEIPRWQLEVLWLVPLQLAVALSRAGQFVVAIDWLRTLYADDQPQASRIVFHGFRLEQAGSPDLTRPQDWLLDKELNPHRIADGRRSAQLRFTLLLLARCLVEHADAEFTAGTVESRPRARALYLAAARALRATEFDEPPTQQVPANPLLAALRGRARANLAKLRRGLTIAGIARPVPAVGQRDEPGLIVPSSDGALAPPKRPPLPTPYRYATLVARAQQLLASAAQVESSYLGALAGADQEGYTELRAADDLELAGARLAVQRGATQIAASEVTTARLQLARADDQGRILDGWIAGGETGWERDLLDSFQQIAEMKTLVAFADAAVTMFSAAASASPTGAGAAAGAAAAAGGRYLAASGLAMAEQRSQEAGVRASWERRMQEWQLQATLARDDAAIASQQVGISKARADVAILEQAVAEDEQRHAQAAVAYLAGRRLTGEMYAWMAGQLGEVYRYLLRQATSVALLAEQQLAFERQQPPPVTIKANYWTAAATTDANQPDRRGLTGSARLLRDLTELDQHAFETDRRKLNLEQVFSLSRLAPEAFARFRSTGVLPFATPMEAFDRRFPGHLLRTIRRVRLSVVALVPPTQGISATLTCSGQSRVVVGAGGLFQTEVLTRQPETVAYTSPSGASGIFDLDPQPELKFWFEDHGVDTTWELQLPRAANPIDYRTIADVLVTIEYSALHDEDYARQIRAALPTRMRGTLALSLREDFPDAWYALVQADPDAPATVPPVSLPVTAADFPRNVAEIRLDAVSLLVVRSKPKAEDADEVAVQHLHLVRGDRRITGGAATAVDDIISSRLGSGTAWSQLVDPPEQVSPDGGGPAARWDKTPTGDWELALSQEPDTRDALRGGEINDLVLVLSYRAELPPWPS